MSEDQIPERVKQNYNNLSRTSPWQESSVLNAKYTLRICHFPELDKKEQFPKIGRRWGFFLFVCLFIMMEKNVLSYSYWYFAKNHTVLLFTWLYNKYWWVTQEHCYFKVKKKAWLWKKHHTQFIFREPSSIRTPIALLQPRYDLAVTRS